MVRLPLMAIGGGFLEVRHSNVIILPDVAERADEIDVARGEQARAAPSRR